MTVLLVATASPVAAGAATGSPGAATAGDRLIPTLGNGGYDARDYDVSFDYEPGTTTMRSSVEMTASATQNLSSFSLDSVGQRIGSVTVNGAPAAFRLDPGHEKLLVTPSRTLHRGREFRVRIDYTVDRGVNPAPAYYGLPPDEPSPFVYWAKNDAGFALFGQPDRAHLFVPSNDTPGDKARFTFRVTVPEDRQVAANGTLRSVTTRAGAKSYVYGTAEEIPTNVVQVAVGHFTTLRQTGPHGLPIVSQVPVSMGDYHVPEAVTQRYGITDANIISRVTEAAQRTPEQVRWLEDALGLPFPFEKYGVLGITSLYNNVALETPTLSTFGAPFLALPPEAESPTMVHELVHQYFGDAVSPAMWDDMWLNEGHAVYYERLYSSDQGYANLLDALRQDYGNDQGVRDSDGPPAHLRNAGGILLGTDVPGALALFALHETVGQQTFERIERDFYLTYRGRSATTADYIATANRVSGQDLTPMLTAWLYGAETPPMPGHPDWTTTS
ncbi:M1 family metallopeptidase [Amycolatopsis thermophila]|uniref:Aminopeptidase N n=1 Tax=Amycolatopsis thermophila TaxID=206084 RepID=A0ABU0F0M1_9PSEU|nr:M1 family metallopeptidase [Amycolatopsis thermophila]MDQ0380933.1 aminopeptidase N [Amycolatopsis thermophila]